jgi:hypothetical protein
VGATWSAPGTASCASLTVGGADGAPGAPAVPTLGGTAVDGVGLEGVGLEGDVEPGGAAVEPGVWALGAEGPVAEGVCARATFAPKTPAKSVVKTTARLALSFAPAERGEG